MADIRHVGEDLRFETITARLERLPLSRPLIWARLVVGSATLFDGFTTLAIAYVMPVLSHDWTLSPADVGLIISSGYIGQLIGALFFGWLAERKGRLPCILYTVAIYTVMSVLCIFAWNSTSLLVFRFLQGIGTGGEVPVASAYINEFVGAKRRGRFFLFYEVLFPVGLMASGLIGYFLVPLYGWQSMFIIGAVPAVLTVPLQFFLPESPRWLLSHGRFDAAEAIVSRMERDVERSHILLPDPVPLSVAPVREKGSWRELFQGIYRRRTFMIWALWASAYMINNGLVTWLPTLYKTVFQMPLKTSLAFGFATTFVAVIASVVCALYIDKVGRRRWYMAAFSLAIVPFSVLMLLGASSAMVVFLLATLSFACIQTICFSLYLYSAELYPTRIRAIGAGVGSAWLRLGSALGPTIVGLIVAHASIVWVFVTFAAVAAFGAVVCWRFAIETRGGILEKLSP